MDEVTKAIAALREALSEALGTEKVHTVTLDYAESGIVSYRVYDRAEPWPLAGEVYDENLQTTIPVPGPTEPDLMEGGE